jgi:hypothetical protein
VTLSNNRHLKLARLAASAHPLTQPVSEQFSILQTSAARFRNRICATRMPAGCLSRINPLLRSYRKDRKSIPTGEKTKLSDSLTFTCSPRDSLCSRLLISPTGFRHTIGKSVAEWGVTTVLKSYIAPPYHRRTTGLSSRTTEFQRPESATTTFLAAIERSRSKSLASVLRLLETPGYSKEFRFTIFYM